MGQVIPLMYKSPWTGVTHQTDDYNSFMHSPDYWGYLHMFNCFLAVYIVGFGLRPKWLQYVLSSLYVMFWATMYSIFQEFSVEGHVLMPKMMSWNTEWEAGKQNWHLFYDFIGVGIGVLYLFMSDALPTVLVYPQYSKEKQSHFAASVRPLIIFLFISGFVPVAVFTGGALVFHLPLGNNLLALVRTDFLIYAAYMAVVLIVFYCLKRWWLWKYTWLACVQLEAKTDRSGECDSDLKALERLLDKDKTAKGCPTKHDIQKRTDAEFIILVVGIAVNWLVMMFHFPEPFPFYLEPLVAFTATIIFMSIIRMFMGSKKLRWNLYSKLFADMDLESYSTTNALANQNQPGMRAYPAEDEEDDVKDHVKDHVKDRRGHR